jgi:hypothetical protein
MLNISDSLCPERSETLRIGGQFASDVFEYAKIEVSECLDTRFCHSLDELSTFMNANKIGQFKI